MQNPHILCKTLICCAKKHIYCPITHIYCLFSHILSPHHKPCCHAEKCGTGHAIRRSGLRSGTLGMLHGALGCGLAHWACYTALLHLILHTWHAIPRYHFNLFSFIIYIFPLYQKYFYISTIFLCHNI